MMKTMKRMLCCLVALCLMLTLSAPAMAATKPSIGSASATYVTTSSARIAANVKNPSMYKITECGFTLWRNEKSTCVDKKSGVEYPNLNASAFTIYYDTAKWYGALKPDSSYGFSIYAKSTCGTITVSGSFKTLKPLGVELKSASFVTDTSARIEGTIANAARAKVTECGFVIWPANKPSEKVEKGEKVNSTAAVIGMWYDTQKWYKALTPETKYEYMLWAKTDGAPVYSQLGSFKTKQKSLATVLRSPMNVDIWATTYNGGHEGANFGALDMYNSKTYDDCPSTKGVAIYPVANGEIVQRDPNQGALTIKHTTPLVTTNGVTYSVWYSHYGHMAGMSKFQKGDKVTTSTVLGTANSIGLGADSRAYHLHFQINKVDPWSKGAGASSAISPYYLRFGGIVRYGSGQAMDRKIKNNLPTP